jgi:hypothetical protein
MGASAIIIVRGTRGATEPRQAGLFGPSEAIYYENDEGPRWIRVAASKLGSSRCRWSRSEWRPRGAGAGWPRGGGPRFFEESSTVGSARGGASKRRYCLVKLRFTSGWLAAIKYLLSTLHTYVPTYIPTCTSPSTSTDEEHVDKKRTASSTRICLYSHRESLF